MSSWISKRDPIPQSKIIVSSSKPLVTCNLRSGLGNRLFQILAGLGYAERTGKQFVLCEKYMSDNFHTKALLTIQILMAIFPNIKIYRGCPKQWNHYYEDPLRFYEGDLVGNMDGDVMLHGYFQNEAHFPSNIRSQFHIPKPAICNFDCNEINFEITYFVHFRLGDYVDSDYDLPLNTYYREAIHRIKDKIPESKFLIFSDQPHKLDIVQYGLTNEYILVNNIGVWETLYLMSLCKGAVCANSTFSWFGAFAIHNSGDIFMPSKWKKGIDSSPNPSWAIVI